MIITAENPSQNAFHRFAGHRGLESHRMGPAHTPEESGQSWLEQVMSNSLVSVTEFGCCLQQENTLRGQQLGNSGKISLAERVIRPNREGETPRQTLSIQVKLNW